MKNTLQIARSKDVMPVAKSVDGKSVDIERYTKEKSRTRKSRSSSWFADHGAPIIGVTSCLIVIGCLIAVIVYTIKQPHNDKKMRNVNLNGLYCLEDWVFSLDMGKNKAVDVVSPSNNKKYGNVLTFLQSTYSPPTLVDKIAKFNINDGFSSELDLINILQTGGLDDLEIIQVFENHRKYFYNSIDEDFFRSTFDVLQGQQINIIRLPITWCIQYDEEYTIEGSKKVTIPKYDAANKVLIEDPFHKGYYWAPIYIGDIQKIVKDAKLYGIRVLIDIHAYPGGSSYGSSYSGVFGSLDPLFWSKNAEENFSQIFGKLCKYIEGDEELFTTLYGISPMNEPAHLFGMSDLSNEKFKNITTGKTTQSEFYTEVFGIVVNGAKKIFMDNDLHNSEILLYSNLRETVIVGGDVRKVVEYWKKHITSEERNNFMVLDIHKYIAWDGDADKQKVLDTGNKTEVQIQLDKELNGFQTFRKDIGYEDGLLASEFSSSVNPELAHSLSILNPNPNLTQKDKEYLSHYFYTKQVEAFTAQDVIPFFLGWDMYNKSFWNEWSLKNILSWEE